MRVAILGAGGTIAPAIVHDLAESEEVTGLLLLDLDGARAEAVALAHGCGRAESAAVDASAELLAPVLGECDVLVNAASYRVNLDAMRACLLAGCHYIDLGGLYWLTDEQLHMGPQFETEGLLALLGMGSSPGKTNVMAARAVTALGRPPERIDVLAAGRDLDPPEGPSFPYSPRTLVDELTMRPVAIHEGQPVELDPLADGGTFDFPEPIGSAQTIYTLHSEMRTFADSFGCREASFRLALAPAVLEGVRALVGASEEEIEAAARAASPPSASTTSVHVIEAAAENATVRLTAITGPIEEWGLGGGIVSTAAPAAAAVRLLARGRIPRRGAVPPERCVHPDDLFPELERRACSFELGVSALR